MNNLKKVMISINEEMLEEIDRNNYDWFLDMLDINYIIDSYGKYKGVRLTLFLGGPNIFVNTKTKEVKGYWGCSEYKRYISDEACNFIDSIFEEYITTII